ncbi:helix-turn-helix domain-containing protein [Streptomyces subrutilus]|uniref:helix-turn-helix domain-containing protein n=1 Tax=Streptomyces subrutilus TaxID=36818 RepID=UPI0033D56CB2
MLRELREFAGLSYDELAAATGLSPATLKRAATGRTVPAEDTAKAFGAACGADLGRLSLLWLAARIADRGRLAQLRPPGRPQLVSSRREVSAALEYFYEAAGAPSLRRLVELAGGAHLLPVSSAGRIVARQALPASRQQLTAFLTACGLAGQELDLWGEAFEAITRDKTPNFVARLESLLNQRDTGRRTVVRMEAGGKTWTMPLRYADERAAVYLAAGEAAI